MKEGWQIKKLGEVCKLEYGKPLDEKNRGVNGKYPVYGANGIKGRSNQFYFDKQSIIIGRKGSAGEINLSEEKFWALDVTYFVTFNEQKYDLLFLYYLMTTLNLPKLAKGVKPGINRNEVYNINIPIPPLPEQQRIVAILDEAFAAINKAKENAQQNLKNAKELFYGYLQSVFETKGDGWEEKKLGDITEVKDGTHDSPKYISEGIPFVTQKNIKSDGLAFDDTRFITKTDHERFYKRSNVTYGDILISMIGANRGMAAIVDDKRTFSIKNVGLIKSCVDLDMNYLLYYLKSPMAMKYVLYMSNGGAQEFVGLTALRSFPIPLASLKEQQTIVHQLDSLSSETKKLESIYNQKLIDLEELKKSMLQKAFAGELFSSEPI